MSQTYKQKLDSFNATQKYNRELLFVYGLIASNQYERILDYGCGTGYAVDRFRALGSDVYGFDISPVNHSFKYHSPQGNWGCVYFMHSFAHLDDPKQTLSKLSTQRVIIVTPNADWLKTQSKDNYTPDPTVVKHYTQKELIQLLDEVGFDVTLIGQFGNESQNTNERIFLSAVKRL